MHACKMYYINLNIDLKYLSFSMRILETTNLFVLGIFLLVFGLLILTPLPNHGLLGSNSRDVTPATTDGTVLRMFGKVDMILVHPDGTTEERHLDNLIVDSGLEGVASRIAPHDGSLNPSSPYNYIALGTSSNSVAADQSSLVSELPFSSTYARSQDSIASFVSTGPKQLILSVTYGPGQATGTISESGIFNSETGGDMLARQAFSTINKGDGDSLTITWTITLSAS
jgi:hypothetical protein